MATIDHGFPTPTVITTGPAKAPLVVLLHGRGSDARDIIGLADHLPHHLAYAAVRAPIAEGGGYAWFANRGIGRPIAESLSATMDWFRSWLAVEANPDHPVILVGFSGGAAFAGGLLLADPARWAGTAILNGTLPFDAGVPTSSGRLSGAPVFLSHGLADSVIPLDLQVRTWEYVTGASSATATARRDPAGHQLTADGVAALAAWLEQLAPAPSKEPS